MKCIEGFVKIPQSWADGGYLHMPTNWQQAYSSPLYNKFVFI